MSGIYDGAGLTERQTAILKLISRRLPIKSIAADLSISIPTVNDHIRRLKDRLDCNSLADLSAAYEAIEASLEPDSTYTKTMPPQTPVAESLAFRDSVGTDCPKPFMLADAMTYEVKAPWVEFEQPRVVPELLDGKNAILARLGVMAAMMVGILAAIVLAMTALDSVSRAVNGIAYAPSEKRN